MPVPYLPLLVFQIPLLCGLPPAQESIDPQLQSAVERYFTTQQEEDVEAYLSLWSASSSRPAAQMRQMLSYVFDTGDDVFSEIEITKVMPLGDRMRVRVSATRMRTEKPRVDGAPPVTRQSRMQLSLTFVREGPDWKLLREGPATDDLAHALVETPGSEERARLLAAEPELLTERLLLSISRIGGDLAQQGRHAAAQVPYRAHAGGGAAHQGSQVRSGSAAEPGQLVLLPAEPSGGARRLRAASGDRARARQRRRHRGGAVGHRHHSLRDCRVQHGADGVPGSARHPGTARRRVADRHLARQHRQHPLSSGRFRRRDPRGTRAAAT